MAENDKNKLPRREFLARTAKAGLSIAGASVLAKLMYSSKTPSVQTDLSEMVKIPNFSITAGGAHQISIVKGADPAQSSLKAIDLLGGIERFVKPGETVVIKPNIAFASPPSLGATTNPQLVAQIVRLCYDRGKAKKVIVTDNPINNPQSCFLISGIGKAASQAGAELLLPRPSFFQNTTLPGGRLINDWPIYYQALKNADKLIGIAPLKDHRRSGASMTMKNFYGLLGGRRNVFHQDINTIIAELAMLFRPTLVILDGTVVMKTNGPTGGSTSDLIRADTLIAGTDPVAVDSFGATLLDMKISDLQYLSLAKQAGVGTTDYMSLNPLYGAIS
ncbi:MAG: DUF362 domain-containing protein [Phycisphaerae bacterium]|jgi:uncharacterized protein (DUF362 family)